MIETGGFGIASAYTDEGALLSALGFYLIAYAIPGSLVYKLCIKANIYPVVGLSLRRCFLSAH